MTESVGRDMARSTAGVRVGVAMPAAGSGLRMGGARKPFVELAGEPLLLHALRPFLADSRVVSIAVALSETDAENPPGWISELDPRIVILKGGETRGASVARAIAVLPEDVTVLAVHDAARPLLSAELVRSCIDLAAEGTGAVAGCPAVDTMKTVDDEAIIEATPDRSRIWHAHTPQVFPAEMLRAAYRNGAETATDDAALVEANGGRVQMVDDGGLNLKVTRPADMVLAEAVIAGRRSSGLSE